MKRPESRLAAGAVLCLLSLAMLINVALVSCEETGVAGRAGRPDWDGPGGVGEPPALPGGPSLGSPTPVVGGPADYRVSQVGAEPEIRVRLISATDQVTLGGGSDGVTVEVDGGAAKSGRLRGPIGARLGTGGWILSAQRASAGGAGTGSAAPLVSFPAGTSLTVAAAGGTGAITINGAEYPGRIRLVPRSEINERSFDVIEHVPLEEYLPGVVAKEMLAGWPLAAYQVQAVCARSYALHERARTLNASRRGAFDVEASERDQAYSGTTKNRLAAEAVRSTRGWVLTESDRLLRAYFSSTCGGRTASAADTWPTGPGFEFNLAAPLQASARESACQRAPLYRWTIKRQRDELVQRLRAYGERNQVMVRQIRDLWMIEPVTVNSGGRPSAYKVTEPGGKWYRLSAEQLRIALNQSVPRSVGLGAPPIAATMGFGAADGEVEFVGPMPVAIDASVPDVDRRSRVASGDIEITGPKGGTSATISGRGFGHGVGMCQYCAKAFAERGEDWRRTVLRFYPGAQLAPAY